MVGVYAGPSPLIARSCENFSHISNKVFCRSLVSVLALDVGTSSSGNGRPATERLPLGTLILFGRCRLHLVGHLAYFCF